MQPGIAVTVKREKAAKAASSAMTPSNVVLQASAIVGTPKYGSPELADKLHGAASDLWQASCTAIQILTRRHPYAAKLQELEDCRASDGQVINEMQPYMRNNSPDVKALLGSRWDSLTLLIPALQAAFGASAAERPRAGLLADIATYELKRCAARAVTHSDAAAAAEAPAAAPAAAAGAGAA